MAIRFGGRLGWVPWMGMWIGSYFALAVYYAAENENQINLPFLLLFAVGTGVRD
jgi:hypothetical protein